MAHPPTTLDRVSEDDENENESVEEGKDDESSEMATGSGRLTQPDPELREEEEETPDHGLVVEDIDAIQQPIPFQMGLTPQPDEMN